jgi:hypothetical protein
VPATIKMKPQDATHWSIRAMAERLVHPATRGSITVCNPIEQVPVATRLTVVPDTVQMPVEFEANATGSRSWRKRST